MDLKRVEHLMLVAEYGSFSKAASVIGIAQPALGRQVQKLEEHCGVRLLYRHGRGVSLTPEGERFVERVRPLIRQLEAVTGDLQSERALPKGAVTVGMTPTTLNILGMPLLAAVREKYPEIRLNIISGYSGYIHEWLVEGRLDIATLHDARRSQHIAVDFLAGLSLYLVSSPRLLAAAERKAKVVDLKRIAGLPLVLPTRNHGLRRTLELACGAAGAELDVRYEMDTLALMTELVVAGLAHTVLAIPAVAGELQQGKLVARKLRKPEIETRLMLATALNRPRTHAIRAVDAEIKALLRRVVRESPIPLDVRTG